MIKLYVSFFPLFLLGQLSHSVNNVEDAINNAKDYYDVSLFDESKVILLDLLHSSSGKNNEAEIRYHLGLASYYSNNFGDAMIQWQQVISKYPENKRAQELIRVFSNLTQSIDSVHTLREEDFEYSSDLRTGRLFWTPTYINQKLLWSELKDAEKAIGYYQGLIDKYIDPKKKFQILYNIFLLESGHNKNNYGFNMRETSHQRQGVLFKMHAVLKEMKEQISTPAIDPNYNTLIQAYYLAGVKTSEGSFITGAVKINQKSKIFFDTVIDLTDNNKNNIYRIFSEHWINIYESKEK